MEGNFDWRQKLSLDDQRVLDSLLYRIQKHRHMYENADNPQVVQMWLILLELEKERLGVSEKKSSEERKPKHKPDWVRQIEERW